MTLAYALVKAFSPNSSKIFKKNFPEYYRSTRTLIQVSNQEVLSKKLIDTFR